MKDKKDWTYRDYEFVRSTESAKIGFLMLALIFFASSISMFVVYGDVFFGFISLWIGSFWIALWGIFLINRRIVYGIGWRYDKS